MLNGIITPLSARTLLTFSCVSLQLFKMLFYSTWQIAELEKRQRVCVGWRGGRSEWNIKSGSDVRFWGLCASIRGSHMAFFDLERFGGILEWGHGVYRGMAGIKVNGLWMAAQSSLEFTTVWYFLRRKRKKKRFGDSKIATVVSDFVFPHLAFGDEITAFLRHFVMGDQAVKCRQTHMWNVFLQKRQRFHTAVVCGFIAL